MFAVGNRLLGLAIVGLLSACSTVHAPPFEAHVAVQPARAPVRTPDLFQASMRCMDDLFLRHQVQRKFITAITIPDQSGKKIGGGTRNMLISAISSMNRRSDAFRFVDLPVTLIGDDGKEQIDLGAILNHIRYIIGNQDLLDYPDYYIIGSVSQLDESVIAETLSGGLSLDNFNLGASYDRLFTVASTDFNVADAYTWQVQNGLNTNYSIDIMRRGRGADLDARIGSVGLFFNISLDRSEGLHAALRALIQLSAIETLGKLAKVPYRQCLQLATTPQGLVTAASRPSMTLTSTRGDQPRYRAGEAMELSVTLAQQAELYCYYRDGRGKIVKLFPNRFRPDPVVPANRPLILPGTDAFRLVADKAGVNEEVLCIASPQSLDPVIPANLSALDLQPLVVRSLDEVMAAFLQLNPELARARLTVRVN